MTVAPLKVQLAAGVTEQLEYAYEPESVPLEHVLACHVQELPNGTVDAEYAVVELPCNTVVPLKAQFAAGVTEQLEYAYEPERVPFEQERVCDAQLLPYGTVDAAYAVVLCPCEMLPPQGREQGAAAVTEQLEYPYEPESVPLEQLRVSEAQLWPYPTELAWYAVALCPWVILPPHGSEHAW